MRDSNPARLVVLMMAVVVGLTFLFGFGNVLNLALSLGVPVLVAPLVAPAVDLTVLGLLIGTRHLAVAGASDEVLRPARRLLLLASVVTLLLNVADPVFSGHWGKAAFDAVGPLLLIGWADVGPGLLRALSNSNSSGGTSAPPGVGDKSAVEHVAASGIDVPGVPARQSQGDVEGALVERARRADLEHWHQHRRPISAETLRKQLRVGASTSRALVAVVRSDLPGARGS